MSIVIQWIIVGICLAGAIAYVLHFCGLFARLGWARPRAGDACGACPCCAASKVKSRLEKHLDSE